MRNLFIPEIGTMLTLAEDWTFKLVNESRNKAMLEHFGYAGGVSYTINGQTEWGTVTKDGQNYAWANITLRKGVSLKVARIYIRNGKGAYSSVTFTMHDPKVKRKPRFFAALEEVNQMIIE